MEYEPWSTDKAQGTLAICIVFRVIATCGFALRICSKLISRSPPALDDFALLLGLIFQYISTIQTILQVQIGGLGHQLLEVEQFPDRMIRMGKLGLYGQYPYFICMAMIRWSICILLLRIFVTKITRVVLWACVVANGLWLVFDILIVSLRCSPFSKNWNSTEPGTCLPQIPIITAIAGAGVAIELAMRMIPIPAVWKLQMAKKKKIVLTCVFGLGIIDIAVGIARLLTVIYVDEANFSWTEVPALELIAVEPAVAVLVASFCTCHPLLERILASKLIISMCRLIARLIQSTISLGRRGDSTAYEASGSSSDVKGNVCNVAVPKSNVKMQGSALYMATTLKVGP